MKKILGFILAAAAGLLLPAAALAAGPEASPYPPLSPSKNGRPVAAVHYLASGADGKIRLAAQILAPGATLEAVRIDNLTGRASVWRSDGEGAGPLTVASNGQTLADGRGKMNFGPLGEAEEILALTLAGNNGAFKDSEFRVTFFMAGGARALCLLKAADQPVSAQASEAAPAAQAQPAPLDVASPSPQIAINQEEAGGGLAKLGARIKQAWPLIGKPSKQALSGQDAPPEEAGGLLAKLGARIKQAWPLIGKPSKQALSGQDAPQEEAGGLVAKLGARIKQAWPLIGKPSKQALNGQDAPQEEAGGLMAKFGARIIQSLPLIGKPSKQAKDGSNPLLGTWKLSIAPALRLEVAKGNGKSGLADKLAERLANKIVGKVLDTITEPELGKDTITFTASEAIIKEGADEKRLKVEYRHDGDNVWSVLDQDKNVCIDVHIIDEDAFEIQFADAPMPIFFKRVS